MKLKILVTLAALSVIAAPAALASNGKSGTHCTRVAVTLKGTVTTAPGSGATQFSMHVKATSHRGRSLVAQDVTIMTDSHTKIVRQGKKSDLSSLQPNDRVNVLLKVCTKDLPLSPASVATMPAKRVTATVAGKGSKV